MGFKKTCFLPTFLKLAFCAFFLATPNVLSGFELVPDVETPPLTNVVVWRVEPEKLPEWGASPDSVLASGTDRPDAVKQDDVLSDIADILGDDGALQKDEQAYSGGEQINVFGESDAWHGRALSKNVEIYEDFTLEWQMAWEQESDSATSKYRLDFGVGWVGFIDSLTVEQGYVEAEISGALFPDPKTREPLKGQAFFKVVRSNGTVLVYRDGALIGERCAKGKISSIQLKEEVFKGFFKSTITKATTEKLTLFLPSASTAPVTDDRVRADLEQILKMDEINVVEDTFPVIVPLIYTDAARFGAQVDLLGFDLNRCSLDDVRKECESDIHKLAEESESFFKTRQLELDRIKYQAGMILQGSSAMEPDAVFRTGTEWQTIYDARKEKLAQRLAVIQEKLKPFARKPDEWRSEQKFTMDNREWVTNSFVLKHENHYGLVPPGYKEAVGLMAEMGCSLLSGTPVFRRHGVNELTLEQLKGVYDTPAEYGIRIAPMFGYSAGEPMTPSTGIEGYPSYWLDWADAGNIEKMKGWIRCVIEKSGDFPTFAGIHFDEINYGGGWSETNISQFRAYLKDKYSVEQLLDMGIDDVSSVIPPKPEDRHDEKVLFMEHREWVAHVFETAFKSLYDYTKSLKSDCLMLPLLSPGPSFHNAPFTASLARMSLLGDSMQIDPYMNGVIDEAYMCALVRNSSTRPLWLTVGTHYGGNVETLRRDYAIAITHADGLFVFDWPFIYKIPPIIESWRPACKEGGWEATWEAFENAKKLEPYLLHTVAETDVAMLHSERTASFTSYKHDSFHGRGGVYHREQIGIYSALAQSHVPVAPVFAETLTRERLQAYRVLILADARCLDDSEVKLVRDWTESGGFLIVIGGSLLLDRWGRSVDDYRLADVMGVKWVKSASGLTNWTLKAESGFMGGKTIAYRGDLKWDEVTPLAAEVLAEWSNGKPAVTVNRFGKGTCCFVSAHYPASCCEWVMRTRRPYAKKYDDGIREFLSGMVKWALKAQGETLSVEVKNCPETVEVTIRFQPETGRYVLHFLNYDEVSPVTGINVLWQLPAQPMRVFYAVDGEVISESTNGDFRFTLRDLDVHEAVVAEPLP